MNRVFRQSVCVRALAALAVAQGLVACDSPQLPDGLTLSLSPEGRSFHVQEQRNAQGQCLVHDAFFIDIPLLLVARDGQGTPLAGVEASIYVDLTGSLFSGPTMLSLYRDVNDNGLIDTGDQLMSASEAQVPRIITDTGTGSDTALLRVNLTCAYRAEILAVAGHATASASVEVVAANDETVEPGEGDTKGRRR